MPKKVLIAIILFGFLLLTLSGCRSSPEGDMGTATRSTLTPAEDETDGTIVGEPLTPTTLPTTRPTPPMTEGEARVTEVIDGDTIHVLIGDQTYTVRYIGIDAPETDDVDVLNREMAEEATAANRRLVGDRVVRLKKDVSETDRFGRLLRYVYVGDVMVNAELVRLGQAIAKRYPPDIRNQELFEQLEAEASASALGVWSQPLPEPTAPASTEIVGAVQVEPTAMPTRKPNAPAQVMIVALFRDAALGQNEPDEYVEFINGGTEPVNMTGWRLESERRGDDSGQVFHFPTGFVLKPQQVCRIYTDEDHPEWCGLSFNHGRGAVWSNNDPDAALLYDASGSVVARFE